MTVNGIGLSAENSIVAVDKETGICGMVDPGVATETWVEATANSAAEDGSSATFSFGTPLVGAVGQLYKLCWMGVPNAEAPGYRLTPQTTTEESATDGA